MYTDIKLNFVCIFGVHYYNIVLTFLMCTISFFILISYTLLYTKRHTGKEKRLSHHCEIRPSSYEKFFSSLFFL